MSGRQGGKWQAEGACYRRSAAGGGAAGVIAGSPSGEMFATRSLLEKASFDFVHVNVDFSCVRLDTVASDHEPLVGLFDLSSKWR